jgi:hypothetical protein
VRSKGLAALAFIGLLFVIGPASANPGDEEIWGTYKLITAVTKYLDNGETVDIVGKNPTGYISYSRDGRMLALIVNTDGRPKPERADKATADERDRLYKSMLAYGGTYTYHGNSIEHHIDISWNETWTGTTVIRDIARDGRNLIYTTKPAPSTLNGRMNVTTLVWTKVK